MQRTYYTSKDEESDLGDYGVRKYDDLTGRFTATDPLWEKYYGWSPYVYSGNDPVNKVDLDGRDIIVLLDKEGANDMGIAMGHSAVLIGRDYDDKSKKGGWFLYSKNGGEYGLFGASIDPDIGDKKLNNLSEFYGDKNEKQLRFDFGLRITTNEKEDGVMKQAAKKQVQEDYLLIGNSCLNTATCSLGSIGLWGGSSLIPNIYFNNLINTKLGKHYFNNLNYQWESTNYNSNFIDINNERQNLKDE